jgi:esterase
VTARVLAHQRYGQGGTAVVLLHGFLGSGRNLAGLARRLASGGPGLCVITVDLTGHGSSPPLPPGADLAALADDVLATAGALHLPPPLRIVGHSLGGRVALRAAGRGPARLGRVVLLDIGPSAIPTGSTETARVVELLTTAPAASTRDGFRGHFRGAGLDDVLVEWLLLNLVADGDHYRWAIDRAALSALHERTNAEDLWSVVESPRRWALRCIRGARSSYVSDEDARRLEAAGCRVTTIEGAGHFLHVDRPAEVVAAVRAALEQGPAAAR